MEPMTMYLNLKDFHFVSSIFLYKWNHMSIAYPKIFKKNCKYFKLLWIFTDKTKKFISNTNHAWKFWSFQNRSTL